MATWGVGGGGLVPVIDIAWAYFHCTHFLSIPQLELVAIAKGEDTRSWRHKVFFSGTSREKNSLKRQEMYGPLKWKQSYVRFNVSSVYCVHSNFTGSY